MIPFLLFVCPIVFLIRPFKDLAYEYGRHRGGFVFLAIGTYIVAYFIFAILIGVILLTMVQYNADDNFATFNHRVQMWYWLSIFATILLASSAVMTLYFILKKSWKKNPKRMNSNDLLDSK